MNKKLSKATGRLLVTVGHLAGIAAIASGITLVVMPLPYAQAIATRMQQVPQLWDMSATAVALHLALATCVWVLGCIVFKLGRIRIQERKAERSAIKLSRGSVMTETLVVMPIFLLLTFGMGQLAVNNIAGILANVASYEAARAAWVWKPEEEVSGRRMGIEDGTAVDKCKVAVALVMLPVAPGDYVSNPSIGDAASKTRMMALGANIPFFGVLASLAPAEAMSIFEAGVWAGSTGLRVQKGSYSLALDGSDFWLRTIRKFTTAYNAANCTINDDHSVDLTYDHYIAMPVVDRVFGNFKFVGLRPGWYATYERSFGFKKQYNTPNNAMPSNNWIDIPTYSSDWDPGY